jgi:hypothetical protein
LWASIDSARLPEPLSSASDSAVGHPIVASLRLIHVLSCASATFDFGAKPIFEATFSMSDSPLLFADEGTFELFRLRGQACGA